jgi:hypothetical protein
VGDAVKPYRVQSRIAEDDLEDAARRRVTVENGMDVFADGLEHGMPPYVQVTI